MFDSLPHHFRAHSLNADVRTLLLLRKAMEKGLINTIGDMYVLLKGLVAKDLKDYGPFAVAFYDYFLNIEIKKGETLESAVARSESFKDWAEEYLLDEKYIEEKDRPTVHELVDKYLNEIHLTSFDIKKILDGAEIFNKDNPDLKDKLTEGAEQDNTEKMLQEAADYQGISVEELLERMRKVAENQREAHNGGSHWIGSGGTSPYGNGGAAIGGIRVGGKGGGKNARAVIGDPRFYPVDTKVPLTDNNIDVALAGLKGIEEEDSEKYLDIPDTIKQGLKRGGIFMPEEKEKITQKLQVLLLIDNGGWSMSPYIKTVTTLFSKMDKRFAHDLKTYYFHNTMYNGAYKDERRTQFENIEKICSLHKNYSVFIIGDADMATYEVSKASVDTWKQLTERYDRLAWLNPMRESYWQSSDTVPFFRSLAEMYPLTPQGIIDAVLDMNRKRRYYKM